MDICDLGEINAPVMVFGGPYSNLQALEALIAEAARRNIPPEHMICTGDSIAYCADPAPVVRLLMDLGIPVLKGNCEEQVSEGGLDCGCGFDEGSTCSLLSRGWYAHAQRHTDAKALKWMQACPDRIVFTQSGRRFAMVHGSARKVNDFIWSCTPDAILRAEAEMLETQVGPVDTVLAGHSGVAFIRQFAELEWVNAGVIGMPENDGITATRYVMLENGKATVHHLQYDHIRASAAMIAAGLTDGYEQALISGYWPSEDILPSELKKPV